MARPFALNSEYYDRVLRAIRKHPAKRKKFLAEKLHPSHTEPAQLRGMIGKVARAVGELENAGYVECTNVDLETWKITDKGRVVLGEIITGEDNLPVETVEQNLTFIATVTFRCPNFIDTKALADMFENDLAVAFQALTDGEHICDFGDRFGDVQITVEGESTPEAKAPQIPIENNDATTEQSEPNESEAGSISGETTT